MKQKLLHYGVLACLSALLTSLAACSHKSEPTPAPSSALATVAEARAWFRQQPRPTLKGGTASRGDSSTQAVIAIDWNQALVAGNKLVAPFVDTLHTFSAGKYGYRFLVVQVAPDSTYAGRIAELITADKPDTPQDAAQLALDGTEEVLAGQQPGPVAGLTGALLLYSPSYAYETGLAYENGVLQSLKMMAGQGAGPDGPDTCYDYYLVGYDNGGNMVVHDFLFPMCTGGIPPLTTGWGGGGGGTTGGGGGGGGTSASVYIPTGGPKVDPRIEVKCFTASQPATVTVYVNQPIPGTNALNGGTVGVGHTFVGIEQNGVTRYMGYYPRDGANNALVGVGVSYSGEVHDNSGSPYNISISTTVTSAQLSTIINYLSNGVPATYNVNSYNCADFGITIGNLAGLNLPATTTSALFGRFNGRSPGQLGEDIRRMNPQSGVIVNTNGGNAPTKQGGC